MHCVALGCATVVCAGLRCAALHCTTLRCDHDFVIRKTLGRKGEKKKKQKGKRGKRAKKDKFLPGSNPHTPPKNRYKQGKHKKQSVSLVSSCLCLCLLFTKQGCSSTLLYLVSQIYALALRTAARRINAYEVVRTLSNKAHSDEFWLGTLKVCSVLQLF